MSAPADQLFAGALLCRLSVEDGRNREYRVQMAGEAGYGDAIGRMPGYMKRLQEWVPMGMETRTDCDALLSRLLATVSIYVLYDSGQPMYAHLKSGTLFSSLEYH